MGFPEKPHMCGFIRTNPHFLASKLRFGAAYPHFTCSFPAPPCWRLAFGHLAFHLPP
jgi:hypothetical protein